MYPGTSLGVCCFSDLCVLNVTTASLPDRSQLTYQLQPGEPVLTPQQDTAVSLFPPRH